MIRALATLVFVCALQAHAAGQARFFLGVGNDVGDPSDPPLRFAATDAERMRDLLAQVGDVPLERTRLVLNQPAARALAALEELKAQVQTARRSGEETLMFVYVSSHARAGVLHLGGTRLAIQELADRARDSGATVSLVIVDACDSGIVARPKGASKGADHHVELAALPVSGQVLVTSSGPVEASQELDSLGGSLFTHHWLTGLRGEADSGGDGRVSLAEAYAYAYGRTLASEGAAPQHPSFNFDLRGSGELVLSRPGLSATAIVFPAPLEGRYVVSSHPRPDVVMEVSKTPGAPLRLAVPAGRYVVRKRLGSEVGLLNLELPYSGDVTVDDARMVRRHYADVALKGGYVDVQPSALFATFALQPSPLAETGVRQRFGLTYRLDLERLWFSIGASVSRAQYRGVALTTREESGVAALSGGWRWLGSSVVPQLGVTVQVTGLEQHSVRDGEAEIAPLYGPLPMRRTLGVSAGPVAGIEVPLVWSALAFVQVQVLAHYLPAVDQPSITFGAQGAVGLGMRF